MIPRERLHVTNDAPKLALAPRLLLVQVVELGAARDTLTEVDLGERFLKFTALRYQQIRCEIKGFSSQSYVVSQY